MLLCAYEWKILKRKYSLVTNSMFLCSLTLSTPILYPPLTRSNDQVFPMRVLDPCSTLQIYAWPHPILLLYLLTLISLLEIMEAKWPSNTLENTNCTNCIVCAVRKKKQSRHRERRLSQAALHMPVIFVSQSVTSNAPWWTPDFCIPEGPAYLREKMTLFLNWFNCSLFLSCILGTQSVQHL